MVATLLLWLFALAPRSFWARFVRAERKALLIAAAAAIAATGGRLWLEAVAPSLGMMTLAATEFAMRLAFDDVLINLAERRLGTPDFSVIVSNACSGYEGISLITVFLAVYLWLFRQDFRFPQVLIVFPIGIAVIWLFNVLRITALIAIGDAVSPEIAIAGFHSNAGWIAFILVSFGMIVALQYSPRFARRDARASAWGDPATTPKASVGTAEALLIPFVVMMAATLLTGAFSAGFDWLYPLKALATGTALWVLWDRYGLERYRLALEPIAIGLVVFIVWLVLVPASADRDQLLGAQLSAASTQVAAGWLFFRLIGSSVIVPLAEELVFRGYLLARLAAQAPTVDRPIPFTWLSFLVSSLLFGLLHDAWIAGTLAGMAYALARYRRGRLGDAVVAHMTTNLLLSVFVIFTQQWSYW
jgi:exosortase E/protease (VPEID-CTERM system)